MKQAGIYQLCNIIPSLLKIPDLPNEREQNTASLIGCDNMATHHSEVSILQSEDALSFDSLLVTSLHSASAHLQVFLLRDVFVTSSGEEFNATHRVIRNGCGHSLEVSRAILPSGERTTKLVVISLHEREVWARLITRE